MTMVSEEKLENTEEKIRQAAKKVFTAKGFSATRTRDIAEEAGINLALLNYYFRSKEKLFDLIMLESMRDFMSGLKPMLNQESLPLEQKIELLVGNYIDLLLVQPELPLFVLNEMRLNPEKLFATIDPKRTLIESHFFKQLGEITPKGQNPFHYLINLLGLIVFPFIAAPMLKKITDLDEANFKSLLEERRKLIPIWIHQLLNPSIIKA